MAGCGRPFVLGLRAVLLPTSHCCAGQGFLCIVGALDDLGPEGITVLDFGFAPRSGIIVVIYIFHRAVLQQSILNLDRMLIGLVLLRLTFFVQGQQMGFFPTCKNMVAALTRKGSLL